MPRPIFVARRLSLAILVVLGFLGGYTASALTPSLLATPSNSIGPILPPGNTSMSHGYGIGYTVEVYRNNILQMSADYVNNTVGVFALANTGSISVAYSLGYGLGAEGYSYSIAPNASVAVVVDPTPEVVNVTVTEVVEKVVEKPCPAQPAPQCPANEPPPPPPPPEPPTVTAEGDSGTDWRVMGAGVVALGLLLLLLARRG